MDQENIAQQWLDRCDELLDDHDEDYEYQVYKDNLAEKNTL